MLANHELFIARSFDGYGGHWGVGASRNAAVEKMRAAGAKKRDRYKLWRFYSELPFAPTDRDAHEDEADAFVGGDGTVNWIRCERESTALDAD